MQVEHVTVVVPAHDEEALLPACVTALRAAATRVPVPVRIVVVLDACSDDSAAAVPPGVDVLAVNARNVGAARRAGFAAAPVRCNEWFATTDADSQVPDNWLAAQLAHATRGATVVAGTVTVTDWSDWPEHVMVRYAREYRPGVHHGHVHGASLGFAADLYRGVGGFAEVPAHEDTELVSRMVAAGANMVWAIDAPVETSARRHARAPEGFASYLLELNDR
ncbi:glycosyltransferase [Rhodococcus sp. NPDC057529]|uniref:glycosyltransferase n=1 Tax=Rhodococcus sp. NPDC057529 TaxID=3346158 RepID=UPI0036730C54